VFAVTAISFIFDIDISARTVNGSLRPILCVSSIPTAILVVSGRGSYVLPLTVVVVSLWCLVGESSPAGTATESLTKVLESALGTALCGVQREFGKS
jgi:hypothetical protein